MLTSLASVGREVRAPRTSDLAWNSQSNPSRIRRMLVAQQLDPRVRRRLPLRTAIRARRRLCRCVCFVGSVAFLACLCTTNGPAQNRRSAPSVAQETSCSLPGLTPNSEKLLTGEDLLTAYNAQAALLHSLRGSLNLSRQGEAQLNAKGNNLPLLPAMLTFRSPESVRLTGVFPLSARRSFDLSSDGHNFRLLVPDGNVMRFIVGPVDAPETSANPRENIRPQMILEAIRWFPAKLEKSSFSTPAKDNQRKTIDVELTTSAGKTIAAQLEFDLSSATLARLIIPDPRGPSASQVDYSDWQSAPIAGDGNRPICFPRRMHVTQSQQNRGLEIDFTSVEVNVPVLPAQFQLIPPPGVTISIVGAPASLGNSSAKP